MFKIVTCSIIELQFHLKVHRIKASWYCMIWFMIWFMICSLYAHDMWHLHDASMRETTLTGFRCSFMLLHDIFMICFMILLHAMEGRVMEAENIGCWDWKPVYDIMKYHEATWNIMNLSPNVRTTYHDMLFFMLLHDMLHVLLHDIHDIKA